VINTADQSIIASNFLLYKSPYGAVKVEVFFKDETVWLTQKAIAELFGVKRPAITKHLKNIFETNELDEATICSKMEHMGSSGQVKRLEGKKQ
jgi:hypothetical protein